MSKSGFQYKKSLSQNFILDEGVQDALAECADVTNEDDVLEIGAGSGGLTRALAARARRVVAVETDARLIPILKERFQSSPQVQIVHADITRVPISELISHLGAFRVVANLPYHITTPVLEMLLAGGLNITSIYVMVQKEAAERLTAQPGEKNWGMLSILSQYRAEPSIAMEVPARCFTPPPHVDSVFVAMPFRESPPYAVSDERFFLRVARGAFFMRRKTLQNNLMGAFALNGEQAARVIAACDLRADVRGETLSGAQLARLADALAQVL